MNKKNLRIGNQTAFSASNTCEPFLYAVSRGFDAFEWFPDKKEGGTGWQEEDLSPECRKKVRETARKYDIRLFVHAPWWVDPGQPGAAGRLAETVKFARDIGAALLNIHLHLTDGIGHFILSLAPLIRVLEEAGIDLSIENTPLTAPEDLNRLFAGIGNAPLGTMRVGMCLDPGHANLNPSTRNDYLAYVDRLASSVPIIHLHLHENYGDADSHLPLFTGPAGRNAEGIMGLVLRLKQRRFSGSAILEQWPQPPSLLDGARDRLREMFAGF